MNEDFNRGIKANQSEEGVGNFSDGEKNGALVVLEGEFVGSLDGGFDGRGHLAGVLLDGLDGVVLEVIAEGQHKRDGVDAEVENEDDVAVVEEDGVGAQGLVQVGAMWLRQH